MNYPDNIYRKWDIVEKDLYGEKHWGLVRVISIFGFKIKYLVRTGCEGFISDYFGSKWHNRKRVIEDCIKSAERWDEIHFNTKVRR